MQRITTLLKQWFASIQGQFINGLTAIIALLLGFFNFIGQKLNNDKLSVELKKDEPRIEVSYRICYPDCPYFNSQGEQGVARVQSASGEQFENLSITYPDLIFGNDTKLIKFIESNNANSPISNKFSLNKMGVIYLVLTGVNRERMGEIKVSFKRYNLKSYIGFYKDDAPAYGTLLVDIYNVLNETKSIPIIKITAISFENDAVIVVPLAKIYSLNEETSKIGYNAKLIYGNVWIPVEIEYDDKITNSKSNTFVKNMSPDYKTKLNGPIFMYELE